jgi:hypothetical protein
MNSRRAAFDELDNRRQFLFIYLRILEEKLPNDEFNLKYML